MRWVRRNIVGIVGILVLVYLFVPIAVIAVLVPPSSCTSRRPPEQ